MCFLMDWENKRLILDVGKTLDEIRKRFKELKLRLRGELYTLKENVWAIDFEETEKVDRCIDCEYCDVLSPLLGACCHRNMYVTAIQPAPKICFEPKKKEEVRRE